MGNSARWPAHKWHLPVRASPQIFAARRSCRPRRPSQKHDCEARKFEDLLSRADAICVLASELNFPFMLAWGLAFRGIGKLYLSAADGEQAVREGLALYRQTGSRWALPFWLGSYASVQRPGSGNTPAAVQEALLEVEATGGAVVRGRALSVARRLRLVWSFPRRSASRE